MALGGFVVQLESDTGRIRWHAAIPDVTRLLRSGDRLFVCAGGRVHALEYDTGRYVGAATVGFAISAAVCDGDRVIVASAMNVACVDRNGAILWSAATAAASQGFLATEHVIVARDRERNELWRTQPVTISYPEAGLVLGDVVAQPDRRA